MQQGKRQVKRGAYAEGLTYSDIISEYPPGMKIRKDVANFVSLSIKDPLCRDGIDMLGDMHKPKKLPNLVNVKISGTSLCPTNVTLAL